MLNMRYSIHLLITISLMILLPLGNGCAQRVKTPCTQVTIDSAGTINSAGTYCLEPMRVVAVAPGAHNRPKIADFVIISPPPNVNGERYDDIFRITLSGDVRPTREPMCRQRIYLGERKQNCWVSIPGMKLHVVVTFNDDSAHGRFQERTQLIADDVASNVIKERPHENSRNRKR